MEMARLVMVVMGVVEVEVVVLPLQPDWLQDSCGAWKMVMEEAGVVAVVVVMVALVAVVVLVALVVVV